MKIAMYAIGLATGVILPIIAKKAKVHNAAVSVVAKGISVTEEAKSAACSIKEEAQDIYAEAKQKQSDKAANKQCCCSKEEAVQEDEKQGAATE